MDKAEVKISRRGSVSIHIPSSKNNSGSSSSVNADVTSTSTDATPSTSKLARELSYRERAKAAIEATLSILPPPRLCINEA